MSFQSNRMLAADSQSTVDFLVNSQLQFAHSMREIGIKLAAPNVAYPGFAMFFVWHSKIIEKKAIKMMFILQKLGVNYSLAPINPLNDSFPDPVLALAAIVRYEEGILEGLKAIDTQGPVMKHLISRKIGKMTLMLGMKRSMLTKLNRIRDDPAALQQADDKLLAKEIHMKMHNKYHCGEDKIHKM